MKAVIYNSFTDRFKVNTALKLIIIVVMVNGFDFSSFLYFFVYGTVYASTPSRKNDLYLLSYVSRKDFILGTLISSIIHVVGMYLIIFSIIVFKGKVSLPQIIYLILYCLASIVIAFLGQITGFRNNTSSVYRILLYAILIIICFAVPFYIMDSTVYPMETVLYLSIFLTFVFIVMTIYSIRTLLTKNLTNPGVK